MVMDAEVADLVVDLGVVDDLAQQEDRLLRRKGLPRRIGQINRALNAITKPKFLRELDRQVAGRKHAPIGANPFDKFAPIVRQHLRLHGLHDFGPAQVDLLWGCGSVS